jgi:hypothetical protein
MKQELEKVLNKVSAASMAATILMIPGAYAGLKYDFTDGNRFEEMSGLSLTSGKPIKRKVEVEEFAEYQIVVDVFRASQKNPFLGAYYPEYLDAATSTFSETDPAKREELAKIRFARLTALEFAVVSVDGVPQRAYLVSGAAEKEKPKNVKEFVGGRAVKVYVDGKPLQKLVRSMTPTGNFKLTTYLEEVRVGGVLYKDVPHPFRVSTTQDRSTMWYGLQVTNDGILMHATPHYSELGTRASAGCIRQSTPDAMWLWNLVTNESGGRKAMIRIHPRTDGVAANRLRELFYDPNFVMPTVKPDTQPPVLASAEAPRNMAWLVDQLNMSHQRIADFIKYKTKRGEYYGMGHDWWNPRTKSYEPVEFPRCGDHDCSVWGDQPERVRQLKKMDEEANLEARRKDIAEGRAVLRSDSVALGYEVKPLPVKEPAQIQGAKPKATP